MVVPAVLSAQPQTVRIMYRAAGACPSERSFVEEVGARTALVNQSSGRETRLFVVTVTEASGQTRGSLQIWTHDGSVVTREVSGENCAEVASALALITALAIDPLASTGVRPQLSPAATSTPSASTAGEPGSAPTRTPPTEPNVPPPAVAGLGGTGGYRRPIAFRLAAGLDATTLLGVAPVPAFGALGFLELAPDGAWQVWPVFRLALGYAATAAPYRRAGAEWQWYWARVDACPVRFAPRRQSFRLGYCLGVEAGAIASQASRLAHVRRAPRLWLAPGLAARLGWEFPSGLLLELGAGLNFPLTRYSYSYLDDTLHPENATHVHRIPPLEATGTAGVGYVFR